MKGFEGLQKAPKGFQRLSKTQKGTQMFPKTFKDPKDSKRFWKVLQWISKVYKGYQRRSEVLKGSKRLPNTLNCSILTTHRTHLYPKPLLKLFASYLFTSFYWAIFMPSHHQKCACKFLTENCQLSNSTQAQESSREESNDVFSIKTLACWHLFDPWSYKL